MVDTKLIKEYVINATALGYDVHKAIELIIFTLRMIYPKR